MSATKDRSERARRQVKGDGKRQFCPHCGRVNRVMGFGVPHVPTFPCSGCRGVVTWTGPLFGARGFGEADAP